MRTKRFLHRFKPLNARGQNGHGFNTNGGEQLYKVDDIVTFGSTYRCLTGHTSQADLYDDNVVQTFGGFKSDANFNILQK